jgi:hypothetical protein
MKTWRSISEIKSQICFDCISVNHLTIGDLNHFSLGFFFFFRNTYQGIIFASIYMFDEDLKIRAAR